MNPEELTITQQHLKDAALFYCQMAGFNPNDLVPSPRDQSTMVPNVDLIAEIIGNQLIMSYCVEQVLKKAKEEAK